MNLSNNFEDYIHGLPKHAWKIPKDDPIGKVQDVLNAGDVLPYDSWLTKVKEWTQPALEMHEGHGIKHMKSMGAKTKVEMIFGLKKGAIAAGLHAVEDAIEGEIEAVEGAVEGGVKRITGKFEKST